MSRSNSSRKDKNVRNMLLLALAYSANIGGTGTIIGTPPNLITVGVIEELFGEDKAGGAAAATTTTTTPVNFASWMMVTVPGKKCRTSQRVVSDWFEKLPPFNS